VYWSQFVTLIIIVAVINVTIGFKRCHCLSFDLLVILIFNVWIFLNCQLWKPEVVFKVYYQFIIYYLLSIYYLLFIINLLYYCARDWNRRNPSSSKSTTMKGNGGVASLPAGNLSVFWAFFSSLCYCQDFEGYRHRRCVVSDIAFPILKITVKDYV